MAPASSAEFAQGCSFPPIDGLARAPCCSKTAARADFGAIALAGVAEATLKSRIKSVANARHISPRQLEGRFEATCVAAAISILCPEWRVWRDESAEIRLSRSSAIAARATHTANERGIGKKRVVENLPESCGWTASTANATSQFLMSAEKIPASRRVAWRKALMRVLCAVLG